MKLLNKEEIYKSNQKKVKVLTILAPVVFWSFLALAILCFSLAIKNSLGNVNEMINLLDSASHNGAEIEENYNLLVEKYGEWVIGNGGGTFNIVFINIKNVVFSGYMMLNGILSVVFLVSSFVLGKWLLPIIKDKTLQDNQDMVNITILHNSK